MKDRRNGHEARHCGRWQRGRAGRLDTCPIPGRIVPTAISGAQEQGTGQLCEARRDPTEPPPCRAAGMTRPARKLFRRDAALGAVLRAKR